MGESVLLLPTILAQHRVLIPQKPEPAGFAEFWARYPRKVGKGAARTAFLKALRKTTVEHIMIGLARAQWSSDPQFIPHPATWLNRESYDDEAPEPTCDPVAKALGL